MTTLTIPQVTLPVGARDFGPVNIPDAEVAIVMTIDRTVAGGLNSLTGATAVQVDVMQSSDGGATWALRAGASLPGGIIMSRGVANTTSVVEVDLTPGTGRKLKATVTVSGPSSVTVAGTLVTT